MNHPIYRVRSVEIVAPFTLLMRFDDGAERRIDFRPILAGELFGPLRDLALCAGMTPARYTTTTEVYPDSPRATPEQCNDAQVAAVRAAIDYALANG